MKKSKLKPREFSKTLLIQESILIWFITISFIVLAFVCVMKGYTGSLPWLAAMVSFPWATYGVSQSFYYNKSKAENTKDGVTFHNMLHSHEKIKQENSIYLNYPEHENLDLNGPI